jgi:hypothetical protein
VLEQAGQPLLNAGGYFRVAVSRRDEVVDNARPAGTTCQLDQPARDDTLLGVLSVGEERRQDAVGEQIGGKQSRVSATGESAAQQVGGWPQAGEARCRSGDAG